MMFHTPAHHLLRTAAFCAFGQTATPTTPLSQGPAPRLSLTLLPQRRSTDCPWAESSSQMWIIWSIQPLEQSVSKWSQKSKKCHIKTQIFGFLQQPEALTSPDLSFHMAISQWKLREAASSSRSDTGTYICLRPHCSPKAPA